MFLNLLPSSEGDEKKFDIAGPLEVLAYHGLHAAPAWLTHGTVLGDGGLECPVHWDGGKRHNCAQKP